MHFSELENQLRPLIHANKLDSAIAIAESELMAIPETGFHKIMGRNLLHLVPELKGYIGAFYTATATKGFLGRLFNKTVNPAAYYCEMNGFSINYDRWFIDLFSYKENGGMEDMDWLSDFIDSTKTSMVITGFEELQESFRDYHENNTGENPDVEKACEVCELLVILRLHELFREAYKKSDSNWATIPMYVTAHDYELIYKVN
ncbi:hypothetical protein AM493_12440 [Flavobacterium akiainvivens]|uniref:Uncharacterized protein n=1 Tax=Flavobacterium akiainvivens TaxID=1202724 RepID=A0A0M8MBN9_9FLAO|nr:hypothetical protein [Flavobacterium akiainvivens]KOS06745.1 hypothetical protein AM493_12440 [Flavobacterium akiainvivens]SFQ74404.1 hypothetical protein SAMN05444144_12021 [Flavobacterium akiainvivens]